MTLGEMMVRFRAKHQMTQKQFAKIAHVTVQTICNVERGTQEPSRLTAEKIKLAIDEYKGE